MPPSPSRPRHTLRRAGAGVAALGLASALLLGACGSEGSGSSSTDTTSAETTTTVVNTTSLDQVKVEGTFGDKPTVSFDPSYVGTEESVKVVEAGTGPVIESGQRVTFDYLVISGVDGSEAGTSYGASKQSVTLGGKELLPIVTTAMEGETVGSRILVATNQATQDGAWTLFVFDIASAETIPTSASGEAITPDPALPAVTVENGVPTIATPVGDPPTSLVVQPLIKGTGPAITAGQTVTMQYVGMIWGSGKVFDESWSKGSVDLPVGAGQVISGFDEGLVGQTVGSRLLLVIPPDKGYGAQGNSAAGIGPSDTLVFVVDILAAS